MGQVRSKYDTTLPSPRVGKFASDNGCRAVTRSHERVRRDRAGGPRAEYLGLEPRAEDGKRHNKHRDRESSYFVESHDVGLIFRSLNLLSTCCVGPVRQNKRVQHLPRQF